MPPSFGALTSIALLLAALDGGVSPTAAANPPSLDRPCSFVSAAEMSTLLRARATAQDEHFRCKYLVGNGWLQTELLDISLKSTQDIYGYDKAHGKAVPGVGDQAYVFGAAIVVKLGDVVVAVDGNNLPHPPGTATLRAIARKIVGRIP